MIWACAMCAPSSPVSVLQIHGTADEVIPYAGGNTFGPPVPRAIATAQAWATYDGCTDAAAPLDVDTAAPTLDLEATIDGDDARVWAIGGCPDGIGVELWTIDDAFHLPSLSSDFVPDLLDFLFAHPKP